MLSVSFGFNAGLVNESGAFEVLIEIPKRGFGDELFQ